MADELELALQYRKHAKALRAAALFDREAKTSLVLKRIAADYDLMARSLEGIVETNTAVGKSRNPTPDARD
jgi:hypothetical protein